jgi:hypothetical protein
MKVLVTRDIFGPTWATSQITVDGEFECYGLEPQVRPADSEKVAGHTAIPEGLYDLKLTYSPRFEKDVLEVMNVPGFAGIRIHPGNSDVDTEGCLVLGTSRHSDWVGSSLIAVAAFNDKIASATDAVTIQYLNQESTLENN